MLHPLGSSPGKVVAVITFNSNIASLNAQRLTAKSTAELQRSYERLSSGLRITRASDDAAGLAIADTLHTSGKIIDQAMRNVNDGSAMIGIMDGALEQQANIVTRLKELAEQAANGTLSSAQRNTLNTEYRSLISEYARIGQTTMFNNRSLLYGTRGTNSSSQVLLQAGETGSLNALLGLSTADTADNSGSIAIRYGGPEIQTEALDFIAGGPYTAAQIAERWQNVFYGTSRANNREQILIMYGVDNQSFAPTNMLLFSVMEQDPSTGLYSEVDGGHMIPLSTTDPSLIISPDSYFPGVGYSYNFDFRALHIYDAATTTQQPNVLEATGLESASRARQALTVTTNRANTLSNIRGDFGALASRLTTANAVLSTKQINITSAESAIRDVDVATEAANLTRMQIVQQAATAVLAQANAQPKIALSLLNP